MRKKKNADIRKKSDNSKNKFKNHINELIDEIYLIFK